MDNPCTNGVIIQVTPTHYKISLDLDSNCQGCSLGQVCANKEIELARSSYFGLFAVGQKVQLEYKKVFQTALIIYVIPIFFFFTGIVISKMLLKINNELLLFGSALLATGLSLFLVHYLNKKYGETKFKIDIKPINL